MKACRAGCEPWPGVTSSLTGCLELWTPSGRGAPRGLVASRPATHEKPFGLGSPRPRGSRTSAITTRRPPRKAHHRRPRGWGCWLLTGLGSPRPRRSRTSAITTRRPPRNAHHRRPRGWGCSRRDLGRGWWGSWGARGGRAAFARPRKAAVGTAPTRMRPRALRFRAVPAGTKTVFVPTIGAIVRTIGVFVRTIGAIVGRIGAILGTIGAIVGRIGAAVRTGGVVVRLDPGSCRATCPGAHRAKHHSRRSKPRRSDGTANGVRESRDATPPRAAQDRPVRKKPPLARRPRG
ncbi:hypothetical protein PHYC_00756 [Phycisphaerales bacterium]|nr:hypothetical protein PHYC_00756 [Phycisphaerales bacterium]